ncbi:hypothetical protein PWT90_06045 [Aphanocladium album]|nr:hypothetical protein PWT90_06045 [Aphanocladium album]
MLCALSSCQGRKAEERATEASDSPAIASTTIAGKRPARGRLLALAQVTAHQVAVPWACSWKLQRADCSGLWRPGTAASGLLGWPQPKPKAQTLDKIVRPRSACSSFPHAHKPVDLVRLKTTAIKQSAGISGKSHRIDLTLRSSIRMVLAHPHLFPPPSRSAPSSSACQTAPSSARAPTPATFDRQTLLALSPSLLPLSPIIAPLSASHQKPLPSLIAQDSVPDIQLPGFRRRRRLQTASRFPAFLRQPGADDSALARLHTPQTLAATYAGLCRRRQRLLCIACHRSISIPPYKGNMTSMSPINTAAAMSGASSHSGSVSPRQPAPPKNVAFELLFLDSPQYRARLPMRVQIYPHDTTDSIVTTVKNFYGLYSGRAGSKGVSFEDDQGNTLIARYENFSNNMIVYVRVIEESPAPSGGYPQHTYHQSPASADAYYEGDRYPRNHQQGDEAAGARVPRQRSQSPRADGASRSGSVSSKKSRSRSVKSHASNALHGDSYSASVDGYSSGDGEQGSVSGRSKEQLGTTDISVENIVEGGRRKRAKFESSELPLFAPPQMPAATSNPSVSPARRIDSRAPLSYVPQGPNPFTNPRSLHGSQSYGNAFQSGVYATPSTEDRRHHRGSISYGSSGAMGILPTPDPTVGSCMSEEDKDVAIQLMRLGEMSNISHGRTSASTLDDTFSGRADATSSTGATSDGESESEDELPAARRQKLDMSGASKLIYPTTESSLTHAQAEYSSDEADYEDGKSGQPKPKPVTKHKSTPSISKPPAKPKTHKPSNSLKMKKPPVLTNAPMSPASAPHSRKPSVASINGMPTGGEDDQPDLSSKPRCQRCRKSKKGCDRQRPCGRCRDAGLSADQCISEDEGNGRKGRYGRHMGVPIKKDDAPVAAIQPTLLPAAPIAPTMMAAAVAIDKNKKRKR